MAKNKRLVFLPLGGAGEIGMNMYLYGLGNELDDMKWIMVDAGITFGDDSTPGVDVILPDYEFIKDRKENLAGIIITHAHEDHIGGLAYIWEDLKCPIYTTPFTATILKLKFEERGVNFEGMLNVVDLNSDFSIKPFDIQLHTLTHSIPEPNSLIIKTSLGTLYHTGDWKIDENPLIGDPFEHADAEDVLAMICDSTNSLSKGRSGSEIEVRENITNLIKSIDTRIFVTSFASNLARLDTIAYAANASNRKLVVLGRSMHRMIKAAKLNGLLQNVDEVLNEKEALKKKKSELIYLCTASQGEPRGAMMRIANQDFPNIDIDDGDYVLFSSKIIPGNEKKLSSLFNKLSELGANIITEDDEDIHVSGHPCIEEMKDMYRNIKPHISVPVHGEHRHLKQHSFLAKEMGVKFPMLITNGDILQLAPGSPYIYDQCKTGRLFLDGKNLVSSDSYHIRDRKRMSYNGILHITCLLDKKMQLKDNPIVYSCGIVDEENGEDYTNYLLEEEIYKFFEDQRNIFKKEKKVHKSLESFSKNFIYKLTGKKPLTNISIIHI